MQILRRTRPTTPVKVSFILLDWSCRESFHMLDYLAEQSVPRDEYEILWVEYYDRQPEELQQRIDTALADGRPSPVDTHVLLEMPRSAYYHKHLMYNAGLTLAAGEIVCICDSDTMVSPTFVESILREFDADPDIVLHHDEVRHPSRDLHPFRYPPFEDVRGPGSTTVVNRRTLGVWDEVDPLHTRNYGACVSAKRADLVAIGGADMHLDYLGHVCGPYEMTFRLVNAGKREVWHTSEFLYHTWHPGEAGDNNYFGPHDGLSMSTTALAARQTRRIAPLEPHPAIALLQSDPTTSEAELLSRVVNPAWLERWNIERLNVDVQSRDVTWGAITMHQSRTAAPPAPTAPAVRPKRPFDTPLGLIPRLWVLPVLCGLFYSQWHARKHLPLSPDERLPGTPPDGFAASVRDLLAFLRRMWAYNRHLVKQCWLHLVYLADSGQREAVVYGEGDAARLLMALSRFSPVRITAVCPVQGSGVGDQGSGRRRMSRRIDTVDTEQLRALKQPILVAAFANLDRHVSRLARAGIPRERLVLMQ